ncbi:hypothetical protein T07_13435 [Trichinella nelsoni]|uniref:Uncharacterized protein n=1 Tax=Trichinella nelsoni TaxID=6336 RepID=A0A0V0SNS1_9BILA|nr:hypothetical protein T07_13435 [Trichinella nelsoni]
MGKVQLNMPTLSFILTQRLKLPLFRTEQHRPSRCDLAWGWWPEVAGRTKTIPAYRRPDRYLGICRPRPGSDRPPVQTLMDDRCVLDNGCLRHCVSCVSTKYLKKPPDGRARQIASSPAVSEPPIGGPSEPPAGAPNKRTYIRCVFRSACILPDATVFLTTQYLVGQEESTLYSPLSFARRSNVWQIVLEHRERTEPSYDHSHGEFPLDKPSDGQMSPNIEQKVWVKQQKIPLRPDKRRR